VLRSGHRRLPDLPCAPERHDVAIVRRVAADVAPGQIELEPRDLHVKSYRSARALRRRSYPLGGMPDDPRASSIAAQPTSARIAAHPPAHALCRRSARRRHPPETRRPMVLFALLLNWLVMIALLFVGCTLMPAGAALAALQARSWMAERTIEMPRSGPLDSLLPQTARITARDGTVLAEIDDIGYGKRTYLPLEEIDTDLIRATMATEDRRYREHPGVDAIGLIRAIGVNAQAGGATEGASTIEMQLARNLYLSDERTEQTLARKMKEALAAVEMNKRFSKDDLLEAYLNVVYYGHRAYGAEAAAQTYFGKSARDLTLSEASLLAGLPQSPGAYDPLQNLDAAKARRHEVLSRLVGEDLITADEAYQAHAAPLTFAPARPPPERSPHWVNYIQDLARAKFGPEVLFTGGLQIRTTIDPGVQELGEQIVGRNDAVRRLAHANNMAMVVIEPKTGQVLAMVGSTDFDNRSIAGEVNVATSVRQPGSSIKPLVYLTGFEHGLNPAVEVIDARTDFSAPPGQPPYRPENYENKHYGRTTLRDALGNSLNVPAVKVLKYVGVPAFKDLARRLGITTLDNWDPRWLSLTLGGGEVRLLELTGAYATVARGGRHLPNETLLDVWTSRGELLHQAGDGQSGEQVVDPRIAYQLLHVMGDPGARLVTFGPHTPLNLDRPHMVKTGTTDDYRDTWTIGCVPQVCVGVWMGNTNNDPMVKVSSSLTAGKVWVEMMQALIARNQWPPEPWTVPEGVTVKRIPNVGSTRPGQPDHEEVYLTGQESRGTLEMEWTRPAP
jgi:penicillin-binding protein 1C